MPPPRKIDLLPEELRIWLAEELRQRGFADHLEVTAALNDRIEAAGLQVTVGKSAVGEYAKALKELERESDFAAMRRALLGLRAEVAGLRSVVEDMRADLAVQSDEGGA